MMKRENWDISRFADVNLPEEIGVVSDMGTFSCQKKPIRVLDLPVRMPEQGMKIPHYIPDVYRDIIRQVIDHEMTTYGDMDGLYVYITIDQKWVEQGKTGRRAGAHSDAYAEEDNRQVDITEREAHIVEKENGPISHTYVVFDCLPTEFFRVGFPLKETDCTSSLKTFDEIASQNTPVLFNPYRILKMTPYVVHRAAVCHESTYRTFMKVSVSSKRYARLGNTKNPLFDYDWEMPPRNALTRNHPW